MGLKLLQVSCGLKELDRACTLDFATRYDVFRHRSTPHCTHRAHEIGRVRAAFVRLLARRGPAQAPVYKRDLQAHRSGCPTARQRRPVSSGPGVGVDKWNPPPVVPCRGWWRKSAVWGGAADLDALTAQQVTPHPASR